MATTQVQRETLTVLGCGLHAASAALTSALRFKTRPGSLIVQDATGRGAMILSDENKAGLERKRVIWVDLADRRHPVSLFQLRRSPHFRAIWLRVLTALRDVAGVDVPSKVLEWASEVAWSLSSDGSVGLTALFRGLSSAETRRWFLDTRNEPSGLGKLLRVLSWVLSFPAVYDLSEGDNHGNLLHVFDQPSVVWLESAIEHFEPKEHMLVQVLTVAAIEDALRTMAGESEHWKEYDAGSHRATSVSDTGSRTGSR